MSKQEFVTYQAAVRIAQRYERAANILKEMQHPVGEETSFHKAHGKAEIVHKLHTKKNVCHRYDDSGHWAKKCPFRGFMPGMREDWPSG